MNNIYLKGYVSFVQQSQTTQGTPKYTCSLGVPRRKKSAQDQTQYDNIRVVAYGETGVNLVDKSFVFVEGALRSYSFND